MCSVDPVTGDVARVVVDPPVARVYAPYEMRPLIKTIPGRRWLPAPEKCWQIPLTVVDDLADALRAVGCMVFLTRRDGTAWSSGRANHGHRLTRRPIGQARYWTPSGRRVRRRRSGSGQGVASRCRWRSPTHAGAQRCQRCAPGWSTMTAENIALMIANLYAEHNNWPVFPLRGKFPLGNCPRCSPKSAAYASHDKAACACQLCHGYYAATCDTGLIGEWWTRRPSANIGIPTGATTGLIVLDEDPRHDGPATLKRLFAASDPAPAPTLEVVTGSDGRHLLYAHPGGKVKSVDAAFGSNMPGVT